MRIAKVELPLLLAIFADLFGFGMLISGIQLRAESLVPENLPKGPVIGALFALTFVIQVFVSPLWGKLSDTIGRKPVLLACQALSGLGLLAYGGPDSLAILLLSRVLSGLGAANVAIAQALVADLYAPEDRAGPLGRMSGALSAGLVLGPAVGGFLHGQANGPQTVGFVAGALSLLGALAILVATPHSDVSEKRQPGKKLILFDVTLLREFPVVKRYFSIAAIAWLALATLEGTFARLIKALFGYGEFEFGMIFGFESLLAVLVPAFLLGWLASKFSSRILLIGAFLLQSIGLMLNPLAGTFALTPLAVLFIASLLYGLGSSVSNPVVNTIVSQNVPANRQGEVFGLLQGARSLGFVLGPIVGGALFDIWPSSAYFLAGIVCLIAATIVPKAGNQAQSAS
jgi:MFS family permease